MYSNHKVQYEDALTEEFEREIERIQMEKLKSEESRLQMKQSLQESEEQIVHLRASVDRALSKILSMEMERNEYMLQVEELTNANETNMINIRKEMNALKETNHALEENLRKCQSETNEQQSKEKELIVLELKRKEKEQKVLAERHKQELASVCLEIQTGIQTKIEELRKVRASNTETISKLTERVAELEYANEDLTNQLLTMTTSTTTSLDGDAAAARHVEEIASLKSTIESLTEEKLQLEWKLRREAERKAGSKERRQMLKARVASLKEGECMEKGPM
jgi:chromosome segregation ATPase